MSEASILTDEQREELVAAAGEHTPVYDYRAGHFTMECEACDFRLYGIDRKEAKRRFGEHQADALAPLIARMVAEAGQRALRDAADEMDEFAAETYPEDIFRRPTSEQYAEINALLKRERGHQLDGIAADMMTRAIEVQAARIRDRADHIGGEGSE